MYVCPTLLSSRRFALALALLAGSAALAQQPTPPQPADVPASSPPQQPAAENTAAVPAQQPATSQAASGALLQGQPQSSSPLVLSGFQQGAQATPTSEEDLRRQLQGKTFFLRDEYLDNSLHFDEQGHLNGNSPQASYTLSMVEIERVKLEKRRLVLEGVRYGLHFLGALPTEDQTAAVDKVRLTTKKKPLQITIDRQQVVKEKKEKEKKQGKHSPQPLSNGQPGSAPPSPATTAAAPALEPTRRGQAVTTSQGDANRSLATALDHVFTAGIDDRMIATLPDYWKLFYKSVAEHQDYKPADPAVLRQSDVDQKAKLTSVFEPPSNEYAQTNGVAGMAMYHVVVGADGKPQQIAVGRPIGFGLDENAVKSIRAATFQPATKSGQPVPVVLDLLVQFRIYSKRTGIASSPGARAAGQPETPVLPGPYTANALKLQPPAADAPQQPTADAAQQPPAGSQAAPSTTPSTQPTQPQNRN